MAFMLRPLAADWSVLPWDRFVEWAANEVMRLGAVTAVLAVALAMARWPLPCVAALTATTHAVVRLAGVGYAVPGAVVIVVGLLLTVGWLPAGPARVGRWCAVHRHGGGHRLGVPGALCAVALQSVQSGYARPASTMRRACWARGAGGCCNGCTGHCCARSTARCCWCSWT